MKQSDYLSIVGAIYTSQALPQEVASFVGLAAFGFTWFFMWRGK